MSFALGWIVAFALAADAPPPYPQPAAAQGPRQPSATQPTATQPAATQSGPRQIGEDQYTRAAELFDLLAARRFVEFIAQGADEFRQTQDAAKLAEVWDLFTKGLGEYYEVEEVRQQSAAAPDYFLVTGTFQNGRLVVRLHLNAAGRVLGMGMRDVQPGFVQRPAAYVRRKEVREQTLTLSAGQHPLKARLVLPRRAGRHPAVLLVPDMGPLDFNGTVGVQAPLRDIALGLGARGVVVLRFEKRSHAHSGLHPTGDWPLEEELIEDALAGLAMLRARPEVDPARIFLVGHGLGGLAAPYIARKAPDLAGVAILAGHARPMLEYVEDQVRMLARLDGQITEREQQEMDRIAAAAAAIRAGKGGSVRAPLLSLPPSYWERLSRLDPAAELARLPQRALVLHAGRDFAVGEDDLARWRAALAARPAGSMRLLVLEELNHQLSAGSGPPTPAEYHAPGHVDARVIDLLAEFAGADAAIGDAK